MEQFTEKHFKMYSEFIYEKFGIYLNSAKKQTLLIRLERLMADNQMSSYEEYLNTLKQGKNKELLAEFAEKITINKTDFFREINHFLFIKEKFDFITKNNPRILVNKEIRIWSAGCSTGEEPYTLAMVLKEFLPEDIKIKILATDISTRVLQTAQEGIYPLDIKNEVESYYLLKYFNKVEAGFQISNHIKDLVMFRLFNLMSQFQFKNTFDIIFCRNVMIYFDSSVQQNLLDKFYDVITPGGILFIGHSESLSGKKLNFKYIQPTVYMK